MGLEIVHGTDRCQLVICLWCEVYLGYKNGELAFSSLFGKEMVIFLKAVYFDGTAGYPAWK